jgi:SseB protein C-terminal domain
MFYGMPAKEKIPELLLERLAGLFKTNGSVEAALFTQVYIPSSHDPPHFYIAIKMSKEEYLRLDSAIRQSARGTLRPEQFVDIVPMGEEKFSTMAATSKVRVFYKRTSVPYA